MDEIICTKDDEEYGLFKGILEKDLKTFIKEYRL